ncbi:hypothetical protein BFJ70_g17542 [Fusarium oxysporum]|nr:hypothetical protein BFJ70_g17542 [Fusarium oxysporum]
MSRPRPQYTVGSPLVIEGGQIVETEEVDVDEGLELRKENAAPGSDSMCVQPGDLFDLPHLPGQETTYVGNGGWSTFVPWGLTTMDHVNRVLDHLQASFTAPPKPGRSREERMARRDQQRKG